VLSLVAVFAVVAGVFCTGGAKTEAPKTEKPAVTANVPEGWPAEAFAALTKGEVETYVKVLPGVVAALKKASFKPVESEPTDLVKDMSATIEAMKPVAGVEDALKAGNMTWDAFRVTTFKVMATSNSMALGMVEAMVQDTTSAEAKAMKEMIAKAKVVFEQVPKANQEIFFANLDQLKALDELGQSE
jgi:hypothetical protein